MSETILDKIAAAHPGAVEQCLTRYGPLVWSMARRWSPTVGDSPTFGELFQQGRFPGSSLASQDPPLPEVPARVSENVTVQPARDLVQKVEAESRFGILQLSRTYEITPAVAEALSHRKRRRSLAPARSQSISD